MRPRGFAAAAGARGVTPRRTEPVGRLRRRFGANDNGTAPIESLWASGNAAATDMPAIAFQLRAQGFNGIRLPFTFSDLRSTPKAAWAKQGCRKVRARLAGAGRSAHGCIRATIPGPLDVVLSRQ
jgi:hypothetical protein